MFESIDEYKVEDIFTPTSPARINFIERNIINRRVQRALKTPGMQVVLYGHSGSGKTTLLLNKLARLDYPNVKTNCTEAMSFESLISDVFIKLNLVVDISQTTTESQVDNTSLGPKFLNLSKNEKTDTTTNRVKISNLEALELSAAKLIGEKGMCWVIEDFHKLEDCVKKKLSQLMKVFMDLSDTYPKLKIIALGAKNTAREVVQLDSEMQNRVSEIYVPLMDNKEIEMIVNKGCGLLNIKIAKATLEDVVKHSNGIASICHHLCLLMCESSSIDGTDTSDSQYTLDFDEFNFAVSEYIEQESDTLKSCFQSAMKIKNSYKVIQSLVECNNEGLDFDQIYSYIHDNFDAVKIGKSELNKILSKLTDKTNSYVLIFDDKADTFCFRDPFHKMFAGVFLREKHGHQKMSAKKIDEILNAAFSIIKKKYNSDENRVSGDNIYLSYDSNEIPQWNTDDSDKLAAKYSKSKDSRMIDK